MQQLVDLFGFLSVVLRAGTLVFQSLLLGGVVFLLWIARGVPGSSEQVTKLRASARTLLLASAVALVFMQGLYLYVNTAVLMTTAEIPFSDVVGANFFISGSIVLAATIVAIAFARSNSKIAAWILPLAAFVVLAASLMTNHAASRMEGRPLLIALTALHEAATGLWIGGLPFLVLSLWRVKEPVPRLYLTERFSNCSLHIVKTTRNSALPLIMRA